MITFLWDNILVNPMTNALIGFDQLFGNFGWAIIAFTILIGVLIFRPRGILGERVAQSV